MVAATASRTAGNVMDLMRIRTVRDDCVCQRPEAGRANKYQRDYLAVLRVEPCNLLMMSATEQESILESFRSFCATLAPKDRGLSIHIRIRNYQLAPYLERLRQGLLNQPSQGYEDMVLDHEAFILHLASQKALLRREFYVRIPLSVNSQNSHYKHLSVEEFFEQARTELARKEQEISLGLARAGLSSHRLNSEELVQYYQSCLHMRQAEEYPIAKAQLYSLDFPIKAFLPHADPQLQLQSTALVPYSLAGGISAKWTEGKIVAAPESGQGGRRWVWQRAAQIERNRKRAAKRGLDAPDLMSLSELLAPASVEQKAHYIKVHHTAGDEYVRARAIIGYPAYAYAGWFDQLLGIDEPGTDIVAFIETLDPTSYVRSLSRSLSGYRATQHLEQRHGRTEDPYIAAARGEVEELREKLVQKTEQVHAFSLYVYTRATDRQTLKERDDKLASLLKALELQSVPLQYEHLPAWQALVDGHDTLHRVRKVDTSTLVAGFPFCSSNLSTEPGTLVGLTSGGGLLIVDPTSDQLENGHEAVFARSGAGKSFYRKTDLSRSLLTGFEAIAIDNETEYAPICAQYNGSYIRLAAGSLQINPLDLSAVAADEQRKMLEEKLDSLLVLFDLLLAEDKPGVLSQKDKSYLARLLTQVYAARGITADPATHTNTPPCMQELFELMERDGDPYGMAERLQRYLPSFPTSTQVALDASLVVFSLVDLPKEEASRLRAVALYLITEFVWSQVRKEAVPIPRLLVIDEAWTLMAYPDAARFLAGISRRARKYNLHLRLATQAVEDFLASEAGRAILLNSSMKFLMKQDSTTIDAVMNAFKLSEEERKFLLSANKGEGLYFCRSSHVPLRVVASERESRLFETDPKKLEQIRLQAESEAPAFRKRNESETLVAGRSPDGRSLLSSSPSSEHELA